MNSSEILGKAISDFYIGNTNARIIVHSPDFDPDEQPVSYYFRKFEEMPLLEQEAINMSFGKVLDIGAAAGAHCLELQKRGADVTGLEISPLSCQVMGKRGVVKILNRDIFDPADEKYDTLLLLMNGIGLVNTLEGLEKFLKNIKSFLNPGGQIIFDSSNLVYLFIDDESREAQIDLNKRYYGEIEFVMEYNGEKSDSFYWLYIDFDTLCIYAEKEGFHPELLLQDQEFQYLARLSLE